MSTSTGKGPTATGVAIEAPIPRGSAIWLQLLRIIGAVAIPVVAFVLLWGTFNFLRNANANRALIVLVAVVVGVGGIFALYWAMNRVVGLLPVRFREGVRPYVFVNSHSTALIAGMSESESDALLEELFSYIYAPDNIYEHQWTTGDLVLWDNLGLQHARAKVAGGVRTLRRVSVARLSYDQQYPADSAWYSDLQEGRMNSEELTAA